MKQKRVSEIPSGKSKVNCIHGRWTRFRTHKNINKKTCINVISFVMKRVEIKTLKSISVIIAILSEEKNRL
jgi:hypothetical protein